MHENSKEIGKQMTIARPRDKNQTKLKIVVKKREKHSSLEFEMECERFSPKKKQKIIKSIRRLSEF